jgi:hypothetical protein
MNNSQRKKALALTHNRELERKKALAQDKIDNPEKYPKPKLSRKTGQVLAILATAGIR